MGIYSTLYIERSKAKQMIIERVATMSDAELEGCMDEILRDKLYNCVIVPDEYNDENASTL